jgi:hypothetical protein
MIKGMKRFVSKLLGKHRHAMRRSVGARGSRKLTESQLEQLATSHGPYRAEARAILTRRHHPRVRHRLSRFGRTR